MTPQQQARLRTLADQLLDLRRELPRGSADRQHVSEIGWRALHLALGQGALPDPMDTDETVHEQPGT